MGLELAGSRPFEQSLRLAREGNAPYEIAMTLQALAQTDGQGSAEADELLQTLDIVSTLRVPAPAVIATT